MDWVKIKSFDNLYQAEFLKEILQEQGINAVVVNNRDSMLLIGEIELYVPENAEKKALELINEYYGLTKINSFIVEKPLLEYKKFVESKGIKTILKERIDPRFTFKNFELFVKNEDIDKARPYLDPANIEGWTTVAVCHRVQQTRYRVILLEERNIDTMVIKRKDADYKLQDIYLLVKASDSLAAKEILNRLEGWVSIVEFEQMHKAEIREELLTGNGIPVIIKQMDGKFKLFVPEKDRHEAEDLLLAHKKWIKLRTYSSLVEAQADQAKLQENAIPSSIVTLKDSMFLIGGYDLYVDEDQAQQALKVLNPENE